MVKKHKLAFWIRQMCAMPQLILKVWLKCWVRRYSSLSYLIIHCCLRIVFLTCKWGNTIKTALVWQPILSYAVIWRKKLALYLNLTRIADGNLTGVQLVHVSRVERRLWILGRFGRFLQENPSIFSFPKPFHFFASLHANRYKLTNHNSDYHSNRFENTSTSIQLLTSTGNVIETLL
jgi:hypothetical protein